MDIKLLSDEPGRRLTVQIMNTKSLLALLGTAVVAVLVCLAAWLHARAALEDQRALTVAGLLAPAAALLTQNQALIKELQAEPFAEKDAGILVAYLSKIRRDGLPKHAQMKKRLEQVADNHVAIVTLLSAYAPQARTTGLAIATERFRKDTALWRERWNTTMELFMAGGNMPETEIPFLAGMLDAVQAEQAAAR
jgi:hypothetical protein